jgi:hypothetical protein
MSILTELAKRYDPEKMKNMVAQLQTMITAWQEAIRQKQQGRRKRDDVVDDQNDRLRIRLIR